MITIRQLMSRPIVVVMLSCIIAVLVLLMIQTKDNKDWIIANMRSITSNQYVKNIQKNWNAGRERDLINTSMQSSSTNCHSRALMQLAILKNSKKTSFAGDKFRSNHRSFLKLKQRLFAIRKSGHKVRLSIGSGNIKTPGFINTNIQELNVLHQKDWENLLEDNNVEGVDNLFSEHMFEHLTPKQVLVTAASSFLVLRNGGRWRIAVPDAYFPNKNYQHYVRAGDTGSVQMHMVVYSKDSLPSLFEMMGYTITLLEYYDEKGIFHKSNYSKEHGFIRRTLEHDKRNRKGNPQYTSLVFDAQKPESCKN